MPFVLVALILVWVVMLIFGGMDLDRGLLVLAHAGHRPALATVARIMTEIGGFKVLLPVTLVACGWLAWRRAWRPALLLAGITLSGRLLVELQKDWMHRLRPEDQEHLVVVQSYAFPSGHAANSTLVFLTMALLLPMSERVRALAVWLAVALALVIGASRVVLGVHWPSDVIGGWALGLFWTLLLLRLAGEMPMAGTTLADAHSLAGRSDDMSDRTSGDSVLTDAAEGGTSQSGASGGNLQRDVASRAEQEHEIGEGGGEGDSVTRIRADDKPRDGDRPNLPNRN
jgi:membrane-associated phospholipid phosphatase